jgi:CRISPR-associated protein (TIGR02584 family)
LKNILVAVTGASPQVLTETIYALHTQGKAFPEEVYVITTSSSKDMLTKGLFDEGHWEAMLDEYQMPLIQFSEDNIWVIADEYGQELDDAKGEGDQSVMADFICKKMAWLTSMEDVVLHASIAGGRKTMAFYMGYAMSLFGREQDSLSHVFVDEKFEFVKDFYYPTLHDNWIEGRESGKLINTKDAEVTLAEIPFVRMKNHFESDLTSQLESASFSKTVAMMNATKNEIEVSVNTKSKTLSVLGVDVKMSPKLLALYIFFVQQPHRQLKTGSAFRNSIDYSKQYLQIFGPMKGDVRVLQQTFGLVDESALKLVERGLVEPKPMTAAFIQRVLTDLHGKLTQGLPKEVVEKIRVHSDGVKGGATYHINSSIQITISS